MHVPGELYDVPLEVIRDEFIPAEPDELEPGVVSLDNGEAALAVFLRKEARDMHGLVDISDAGGWRAYRQSGQAT